jgi:hypothetical protein
VTDAEFQTARASQQRLSALGNRVTRLTALDTFAEFKAGIINGAITLSNAEVVALVAPILANVQAALAAEQAFFDGL